jgi:hypothetical protein
MESLVVVACSMFIFGIVAATHIPAFKAETKMYPNVPDLQAIFATICSWNHILNRGEMFTNL